VKALQLLSPGRVAVAQVEPPVPSEDQLLVRTGAATLCTSDLNDIRDNPFHIALPATLGHEGAGTVAAMGRRVRGFRVGDRVAAHPVHPCGRCEVCAAGLGHLCPNMQHFGLNLPGTLAEYFVVRADRARVLPATVDMAVAALAEPVCVCLEALAQARLSPGQSLLILGDGPFGIIMARLAARLDLARVVVAGWRNYRLSFVRGAQAVNTAGDSDPARTLRSASGGRGFDAAILAVASPQALDDGLRCLRPRGRLVVFASLHGATPVDLFAVQMRELEIAGAVNDADRLDEAVRVIVAGAPPLDDLVTHRLPLDAYETALALAAGQAEAIKVAFVF
jgi:threonine dehydrogenase-like Zn-dependent dehydrogenase